MCSATRRSRSARRRLTTAEPRDWLGAERDPSEAARLAALYDLAVAPLEGGPDVEWFSALARRTGGPVPGLGCGRGRVTVASSPEKPYTCVPYASGRRGQH